jgi:predicted RNA-binding Zn ribbon-like protein
MIEVVNGLLDGEADIRALLVDHDFTRASIAPAPAIERVESRMRGLVPRIVSLPDADAQRAVDWVNAELSEIQIAPSLTEHDGAPLHIHWTPSSARFDDQVIADVLMALAQELCDNGTSRFGSCSADECEHLFYDATRNRSRRFCNDPRCASRTHTADHRRRARAG